MLHSTRGGAATPEREFTATLNWFASPASGVSAHVVIDVEGRVAQVVPAEIIAWHAREFNVTHLGAELVQPHAGDPISNAQYSSLAWWLVEQSQRFGFPLTAAALPEHRLTPPGVRDAKSDIGPPFDIERLLALMGR